MALSGLLSAALSPALAPMAGVAWLVLSMAVPYVWFYKDAAERGFARTYPWSRGIILFSLVAVPLYLFKSRQPGQRLRAIAKALSVLLLSLFLPALSAELCALVIPEV